MMLAPMWVTHPDGEMELRGRISQTPPALAWVIRYRSDPHHSKRMQEVLELEPQVQTQRTPPVVPALWDAVRAA